MIVQLNNGAEQLLAELGDPSAAGVLNACNQSPNMQPFQEPTDPGSEASEQRGLSVLQAQQSASL